ncbi:hypothetical protein B0I35DRAFT_477564 [Stachybotrys elegans]|uniref:HIT-type domain-containing protein n=1 Tax=Stachybotrys elegans TaxID=80388 RepID=A0A8K0WTX4_9HYPO|nr:hypothetical protein B0I35DRAFT_477564 [Stachybotrys elegans]
MATQETTHDAPASTPPPAPQPVENPENGQAESSKDELADGPPDRAKEEAPAASALDNRQEPVCGVCNTNPPKYKCPRCYLPYCSVACNRTHRENHPPDPEPEAVAQPLPAPEAPKLPVDEAPDPKNPFRALDSSDKLRHLFTKYPSLPDQLLRIHAATLPPSESKPAIPASLMKGISKKAQWNHDVGLRRGKEALRRARKAHGQEGAAIREYTELILHIMNGKEDLTRMLQQKVAEEDTRLIERLLAEEKR